MARGVVGIIPSGGRTRVAVGCEHGGAAPLQDIDGHSKGRMPTTLKLAPPRLYVVRMCLSCVCVCLNLCVLCVCMGWLSEMIKERSYQNNRYI